jgi:hypothetical protein
MNAIEKAIYDVTHSRIPKALLEKTFIGAAISWREVAVVNLDEQIRSLVIVPRVLVDCDLVGGEQAVINLDGLSFFKPDDYQTVIKVPMSRTNQRTIMSALHVSFLSQSVAAYMQGMNVSGTGYNSNENSATMNTAAGVISALDKIPVVSTAKVALVAENTILIRDIITMYPNCYLRCILANDSELANINHRSYPAFTKLVEYAVKAYIYNKLIIEIGEDELRGGQALGVFKTILDSYADAEQNYQDYLKTVWTKTAVANDQMTYERLIKVSVGGYR